MIKTEWVTNRCRICANVKDWSWTEKKTSEDLYKVGGFATIYTTSNFYTLHRHLTCSVAFKVNTMPEDMIESSLPHPEFIFHIHKSVSFHLAGSPPLLPLFLPDPKRFLATLAADDVPVFCCPCCCWGVFGFGVRGPGVAVAGGALNPGILGAIWK